jgi:hypothetical protein
MPALSGSPHSLSNSAIVSKPFSGGFCILFPALQTMKCNVYYATLNPLVLDLIIWLDLSFTVFAILMTVYSIYCQVNIQLRLLVNYAKPTNCLASLAELIVAFSNSFLSYALNHYQLYYKNFRFSLWTAMLSAMQHALQEASRIFQVYMKNCTPL